MNKIVSVIVEDIPEESGMYLVQHRLIDGKEMADVDKPHKRANMFDCEGNMIVRYYTEEEWYGREDYKNVNRNLSRISLFLLLAFFNSHLEFVGIKDVVTDIINGDEIIEYGHISNKGKELIDYIKNWDDTTPFDFESLSVVQEQETYNGVTYYIVKQFLL